MPNGTPLELAGGDEPTLDTNSNTNLFPSFIDFLKNTDAPLAASRTKTNMCSNVGEPSSNSPTTSINTITSSVCVEKETHDNKATELANYSKTMPCDFSSPGFVASLENKNMMDALNFTHAARNTDDTSANTTADELNASTKVEAADSHKMAGIMNDEKEIKCEQKERILKRVLVSQDKKSRKWRAYFFYDKFRQATFETQEDGYLFHKMLRKKLAQSESYNDKESMDELVANICETIMHDNTKKAMRDQNIPKITKIKVEKEVESTSLSDNFSSLICTSLNNNDCSHF